MKQTVIFTFLAFLFTGYAFAQSPNDMSKEHYDFIIEAKRFLTAEGYTVSYDKGDQSLNFKHEGNSYWIEIRDDEAPFYIRYHRAGFNTAVLSENELKVALEAVNYANVSNYCGLALLIDAVSALTITTDFYCSSVESFKSTFYANLRALDKLRDDVRKYFDEHQ